MKYNFLICIQRIRVGLLSEMKTRASIKNIDFVGSDVLEGKTSLKYILKCVCTKTEHMWADKVHKDTNKVCSPRISPQTYDF